MITDIPFVPILVLGTLVFTTTNFLKYLAARDWSAVTTQAIAWVVGVGVAMLFAHTQYASGITVGGRLMNQLNWWSLLLLGLVLTSLLSTVNQGLKAFDINDTAATPKLLPRYSKKHHLIVGLTGAEPLHAMTVTAEPMPEGASAEQKIFRAQHLMAEATSEILQRPKS